MLKHKKCRCHLMPVKAADFQSCCKIIILQQLKKSSIVCIFSQKLGIAHLNFSCPYLGSPEIFSHNILLCLKHFKHKKVNGLFEMYFSVSF